MKKKKQIIISVIAIISILFLLRYNPLAHEFYARCRIWFAYYNLCDYGDYTRVKYEAYQLGDGEMGYVMYYDPIDENLDDHFYISFDAHDQIKENYQSGVLQKENMVKRLTDDFQNEISQDIQEQLGNYYSIQINHLDDEENIEILKENNENGAAYSKDQFSTFDLTYTLSVEDNVSYEELTEKMIAVQNYLKENGLENVAPYKIVLYTHYFTGLTSEDITEDLPELLKEAKAGNSSHIQYH